MQFFSLEMPLFRWGDYGDILFHGMSIRDEDTGLLKLERTGIFVPPITFPGMKEIVVTEYFRNELEKSQLTGFTFQPIIKHRIVDLDWTGWNGDEPDFYPESGEPEDYIFDLEHSLETSEKMTQLWELSIQDTAHVQRDKDPAAPYGVRLSLLKETWNGDDFFRAPEVGYNFVSQKAKVWLEGAVNKFVDFKEW